MQSDRDELLEMCREAEFSQVFLGPSLVDCFEKLAALIREDQIKRDAEICSVLDAEVDKYPAACATAILAQLENKA
jgi:hypothetical protein